MSFLAEEVAGEAEEVVDEGLGSEGEPVGEVADLAAEGFGFGEGLEAVDFGLGGAAFEIEGE